MIRWIRWSAGIDDLLEWAVLPFDAGRESGASGATASRFTLYVEGPRDRAILRAWAYRLMPAQGRRVFGDAVILGGRRPARAIEHFRAGAGDGDRGLCVLDRDHGVDATPESESGLDFFTWSRRHIESYLIVPDAIRRALCLRNGDRLVERVLEERLPTEDDEHGWGGLDAKALLGNSGILARTLGRPLPLARIAQATRESELHADVHALFDRLRDELARLRVR
jgi:hypothetical protein